MSRPLTGPRAMLITPDTTYSPGRTLTSTPTGVLSRGLPALLDALDRRHHGGEVTIILDGRTAAGMGLPVRADLLPEPDTDHPVHVDVRAAGWECSRLHPWTTYHAKGRTTVHVGILPLASEGHDLARYPWLADDPCDTVDALHRWHQVTGSAWRGTPGVAGVAIMRETGATRGSVPYWLPRHHGPLGETRGSVAGVEEHDFKPGMWGRPPNQGVTYAVQLDARRMYIGGASLAPLAVGALAHTGPDITPTADLGGWVLCDLAPWHRAAEIPDPAGYIPGGWDGPRWLTIPTVLLLDQLHDAGEHGGYTILDSWTAPARRVLRPWAEIMRDAWLQHQPRPLPHWDGDLHAVQRMAQATYRQAWGMLASTTGRRVYRPDWHYSVLAQARASLWRRVQRVGEVTGRWPLTINVDGVWYGHDHPDDTDALVTDVARGGMEVADRIGGYSLKHHVPIGDLPRTIADDDRRSGQ